MDQSEIFCLGTEALTSEVVHITQGITERTALCGFKPVNVAVTGIEDEQTLCDECFHAVEASPIIPTILLGQ